MKELSSTNADGMDAATEEGVFKARRGGIRYKERKPPLRTQRLGLS